MALWSKTQRTGCLIKTTLGSLVRKLTDLLPSAGTVLSSGLDNAHVGQASP